VPTATPIATSSVGPVTNLHYTDGDSLPAGDPALALGFNLADVGSVSALNSLPTGVKGLVWLGLCNGADATFVSAVQAYAGNPNLFGFYLMDEPDSTGVYAPLCTAANLKAESDYIHANLPGAKTFIVMMNMGGDTTPNYMNTFNPSNTDIDLFGLDPYPCKTEFNGCNFSVITSGVAAAQAAGINVNQIVPLYQAFGGGGYSAWIVPTAAEAQQGLATWATVVPHPVFDYAYSWAVQQSDTALSELPGLQAVYGTNNLFGTGIAGSSPSVNPTPAPTATPAPTPKPTPAPTPSAATAGATLFSQNCAVCHSQSSLSGTSASSITSAIKNVGAMSGISLTAAEISDIATALGGTP
jgi:mono/diheme cytochrome c family protein